MENFANAAHTAIKLGGYAKLALNPTPLGVGMAVADAISKEATGKSLAGHVFGGSKTKKPTSAVTPSLRAMNEGEQAMAKKDMKGLRGYAHGGVVSHKSISACEKAMTRKQK